MLKQVTVPIMVDDHEPEKCGDECEYLTVWAGEDTSYRCELFSPLLSEQYRCKQCLEEAK